MDGELCELREC